jgi:hypothetical protein
MEKQAYVAVLADLNRAASSSSPAPSCTPRCPTRPAAPGSPSTSGWSTGATSRCTPNVDSECTGTNLGDFMRATDLERLPASLIGEYDSTPV